MCTYTSKKDDPLWHSRDDFPEDVINDMTKSLLNESLVDCGKVGLSRFCEANLAPAVSRPSEMDYLYFLMFSSILISLLIFTSW